MSLYSINAIKLRLNILDNPKIVTEILILVDTYFRAILSLQKIIVEIYKDSPSNLIRKKIENYK